MIINPAIIAMLFGSLLLSIYCIYASSVGVQILKRWDIQSGSERQLRLERKTYLVSTIFAYLLSFELLSLFLFIYSADHLHTAFVGAMCAAGSLNVNDYGYPALFLKLGTFVFCGVWLIVNAADNRGFDYPLIRTKYKYLLWAAGLIVAETVFQSVYFMGLKANVITSCCGTLFSIDSAGIAGDMTSLPPFFTQVLFFMNMVLIFRTGIHFLVTGRAAGVFSVFAGGGLVVSIIAIISFISPYYYELPTHHCPFCLLQKDYHYIGYPLYLALFTGGITGLGVGVLQRLRGPASLERAIPMFQKRLCAVSLICYAAIILIALYPMVFSDFILET